MTTAKQTPTCPECGGHEKPVPSNYSNAPFACPDCGWRGWRDDFGLKAEVIGIDAVAATTGPGETPKYSHYGYIIEADGKVHALTDQYTHGVICAILNPEIAKKHGYEPPDEDFNVYHYQRFELDHKAELPVIRISFPMFSSTNRNISTGAAACPEAQIEALRAVAKVQGWKLREKVHLCGRDSFMPTLQAAYKELAVEGEL